MSISVSNSSFDSKVGSGTGAPAKEHKVMYSPIFNAKNRDKIKFKDKSKGKAKSKTTSKKPQKKLTGNARVPST